MLFTNIKNNSELDEDISTFCAGISTYNSDGNNQRHFANCKETLVTAVYGIK